MTTPRNVPASIRQRLLNQAKKDFRPFQELLLYFTMERFLYRLSQSKHADQFILKGALMLQVWCSLNPRPTKDIDLLGRTSLGVTDIVAQIRDILTVDVQPDGLVFHPNTIQTESITEDAQYEGTRIRFQATLCKAQIRAQIDIGFGDVVHPEPVTMDLPVILNLPAPRMLCYSQESAIAEKFEAMVKLDTLNSRMKDFYDIWLLSRQFNFDGPELAKAIGLTFKQRGTPLPRKVEALTKPFVDDKQPQWSAFHNRLQQKHVPASFADIVASIAEFLSPVIAAITSGSSGPTRWRAPGPWT